MLKSNRWNMMAFWNITPPVLLLPLTKAPFRAHRSLGQPNRSTLSWLFVAML